MVAQLSTQTPLTNRPPLLKEQPPLKLSASTPAPKVTDQEKAVYSPISSVDVVSQKLGLNYPANPKLKYTYPAPNPLILNNMMNALASVPRLYTQVLHLMNKMNLPAPFSGDTPKPPMQSMTEHHMSANQPITPDHLLQPLNLGQSQAVYRLPPHIGQQVGEFLPAHHPQMLPQNGHQFAPQIHMDMSVNPPLPIDSSEESEIEEDEEQNQRRNSTKVKLVKRKRNMASTNVKNTRMKFYQQKCVEKSEQHHVGITDVFENVTAQIRKPLQKVNTTIHQTMPSIEDVHGFGKMEPVSKPIIKEFDEEIDSQMWGETEFIKAIELRNGRLSTQERNDHKLFKKYVAGEPSSRLYVKNLTKQTTDADLHRIFGRYVDWSNQMDQLTFDIRIMTEGRMKGQAFITLPNQEAAEYAVKETNGFVLNGKPMVVLFGRSAKPKDDDKIKK